MLFFSTVTAIQAKNAVRYIAEVDAMPLEALSLYLQSKYAHETTLNNYMADMARFAAWANVKDGEKLPSYRELTNNAAQSATRPKQEEATDEEIFDMLYGDVAARGKI